MIDELIKDTENYTIEGENAKELKQNINSLKYFDVYQEHKGPKQSACTFEYSFNKPVNIHKISFAPTSDKDHVKDFNIHILNGRNTVIIPMNTSLPDTYEYVQDFTLPHVFNTAKVQISDKSGRTKKCTIPEVAFYGPLN